MATDHPSFDELEPIETESDNDEDEPTKKLEPGEAIVAEVRHIEWGASQFGNSILHLTDNAGNGEFVKMYSNGTIDRRLTEADVGPGDVIGLKKDEEPYTYTAENDDGEEEEREAYGFDVRVLEGE